LFESIDIICICAAVVITFLVLKMCARLKKVIVAVDLCSIMNKLYHTRTLEIDWLWTCYLSIHFFRLCITYMWLNLDPCIFLCLQYEYYMHIWDFTTFLKFWLVFLLYKSTFMLICEKISNFNQSIHV